MMDTPLKAICITFTSKLCALEWNLPPYPIIPPYYSYKPPTAARGNKEYSLAPAPTESTLNHLPVIEWQWYFSSLTHNYTDIRLSSDTI